MGSVPTDREIRNRRITAVVLLVAVAIGILAAVDVGPFADRTEEDRVREAVEVFVAARQERDFDAVCDALTPALKRQAEATSGATPGSEPPTCAEALTSREEAKPDPGRDRDIEVGEVSVRGNRARASVEQAEGISRSIALELIDGEWLVSTLAG
jgi:hypothetical protein